MASTLSPLSKQTKEKVSKVIGQARDSLKILQTLEKETRAKARNLVKLPTADESRKLTNEKIVAGLKKLGLVTVSELEALEARIEKLEAKLEASAAKRSKTSSADASV